MNVTSIHSPPIWTIFVCDVVSCVFKSYTRSSAAIVAGHLATVSVAGRFAELKTVDIADIIAGRPEEEALEVLRTICSSFASVKSITSIDVSDNALGAKGLDACAALLEGQSCLVTLKVSRICAYFYISILTIQPMCQYLLQ